MIAHLNGILDSIENNVIVIDVNGVGYKVMVPISFLSQLPKIGEKVKVYTYQVVREDSVELFGFGRKEERHLFSMLLSVSGVGPKTAAALISGVKMEDLVIAITMGNVDSITRVPGVGTKTAQKIVIDLKEKIAKAYQISAGDVTKGIPGDSPLMSDAISALMTLGYTPKEARDALNASGIDWTKVKTVEEVIKLSLKSLI
jgi:holliday junction DNA helicase RuvA